MAAPRAGAPRAALGGHAGDEGGAVPGCPRRAGRAPGPTTPGQADAMAAGT
jgi:hypothetical protein